MEDNIRIEYQRPRFHRRVLANFVDGVIFIVIGFFLFLSARAVIEQTPGYKEADAFIDKVHLDSKLYAKNEDGTIYDVVSLYGNDSDLSGHDYKQKLIEAIDGFIVYLGTISGESQTEVMEDYDEFRLDETLIYDGVPYFIRDEVGLIVENPDCNLTHNQYAERVYARFIDERAQGYLVTEVPGVASRTKFKSNMILFVELPSSVLVSGVLTFLLPPLTFFRRGRKTLGKALYKVGVLNSECLNVSTGIASARFAITFFGVIVLSVMTFGIPLFISFSMMAFSKERRGFADYMLNLTEVDCGVDKIYYSLKEVEQDYLKNLDHKAPSFNLKDRL